jgi:hypothetical protein
MRFLIFFSFLIVQVGSFAQVPGNSLLLTGPGKHVSFGEVLGSTRTISFWIKPSAQIDSTNAQENPILVRDQNGPGMYSTGEFAIYFGSLGTPEAGNLVFLREANNTSHKIKSDQKLWNANQWYHVAAVLHPTSGMQLYINGVLQQDQNSSTEPIYMRSEGNTGDVYLGRWGYVNGYGIQAEFDELRFYNVALSQTDIRTKMCQIESSTNLRGYYTFDNATTFNVPTSAGTINGQPAGLLSTSIIVSNAPLGQTSANLYDFTPSSSLTYTRLATVILDSLYSASAGVHVYSSSGFQQNIPGSIPYFYGVWFTGTSAAYRAKLSLVHLVLIAIRVPK